MVQPWYDTGHLHECVMTWCGELQWRSRSARELACGPGKRCDVIPPRGAECWHLVYRRRLPMAFGNVPMAAIRCTARSSTMARGVMKLVIREGCVSPAGPDELDHQWHRYLKPGGFTAVPAAVAVVPDGDLPVFDRACRAMTQYRGDASSPVTTKTCRSYLMTI